MRHRFLYIVLMLSFASQILAIPATTQPSHKAMAGTVVLQDDEIQEILTAKESYAYFGSEVSSSLVDDLLAIHGQASHQSKESLDAVCTLIAAGRTTAPTRILKAALEEAASCLNSMPNVSSDEIEKLAESIETYYNELETGKVELIVEASDKAFTNKLFTGDITVAGNATIKGNENVYGHLTVNSDETILGNLFVGQNETIGGNLTVKGQIISTNLTGNAIINGGQPGPLTIGTNNATSLTFITNNVPNLSVNAAGNVTIAQPISGNTLTVNGTLLTNTIITTTASFAAYLPTYAPLAAAVSPTSNVTFYGDSIVQGGPPSLQNGQEWPALIANYFGFTYNNPHNNLGAPGTTNLALGGNLVDDWVNSNAAANSGKLNVYVTRPPGTVGTVFTGLGFNDITNNGISDFNEQRHVLEAATLFCCLPDTQKVNSRNATQTGTWANITGFGQWGVQTSTASSSLLVTVTGRIICFALETSVGTSATFSVAVDGAFINPLQTTWSSNCFTPTTPNGSANNDALWFYDTRSSPNATHTILVTYQSGGTLFIPWFAGFNINNSNCNTVFLVAPTECYYQSLASPNNAGNETRRSVYIQIMQNICRKYRKEYGLPVYFIDMSYPAIFGMVNVDNIHPNVGGQQYMANRAISVIQNGEFNYLT